MKAYFVIDLDTDGILLHAPTLTTAATVSAGISASIFARVIVGDLPRVDLNKELYRCYRTQHGLYQFALMHEERKTEEFKQKKNIAILRGRALYTLELFLEKYLDKTHDFYDQELDHFVVFSLLGCDPTKDQYTDGVREYASVLEIPVEAAYNELRLRVETFGMAKLKNYARYKQFSSEINNLFTEEAIETKLKEWYALTSGWTR